MLEFRKKATIHAFQLGCDDLPDEIPDGWKPPPAFAGTQQERPARAGDWIAVASPTDIYTIDHQIFEDTYEVA